MENNIIKNPSDFCRTCLNFKSNVLGKLQSIFDQDPTMMDYNLTYSDMLQFFTNRLIDKQDELPKNVCIFCIQQIRFTFLYKLKVDANYDKLISMFDNASEEANSHDVESIESINPAINSSDTDDPKSYEPAGALELSDLDDSNTIKTANYSEQLTSQAFRHKYFVKKDGKEFCKICKTSFTHNNSSHHMIFRHSIFLPKNCQLCDEKFYRNRERNTHMKLKHPDAFKCRTCECQFSNSLQYAEHMIKLHNENVDVIEFKQIDIPVSKLLFSVKGLTKTNPASKHSSLSASQDDTANEVVDETCNNIEEKSENYPCTKCNQSFDTNRDLRAHLRSECVKNLNENITNFGDNSNNSSNEQDDEKYTCEHCENIFKSLKALKIHDGQYHRKSEQTQNMKPFYVCDVCNENATSRRDIIHHLKRYHGNEFHCGQCGSYSGSYILSKLHLMKFHATRVKFELAKRNKCPHCYRYFNEIDSLNEHVNFYHENVISHKNVFPCEACSMIFKDEISYNFHCEQHYHKVNENLLIKEQLHFDYEKEETYSEIQDETDSPPIQPHNIFVEPIAEFAGRTRRQKLASFSLNSEGSTKNNENVSSLQQPDEKNMKEIADESIMAEESSAESQINPNTSSVDDQANTTADAKTLKTYRNFILITEEGSKFTCRICSKTTTKRRFLLHHLKSHTEVPTFSCNFCSEKFLFKAKRDQHEKLHLLEPLLNEKMPFRCELCAGLTFKYNFSLKRHNIECHSGQTASAI